MGRWCWLAGVELRVRNCVLRSRSFSQPYSSEATPMKHLLKGALLLLTACICAPPAPAQREDRPDERTEAGRVPVTIVLADSLAQPDGSYLVVRRADATPADVILLRAGADADQLSDGVRALLVARQAGGD